MIQKIKDKYLSVYENLKRDGKKRRYNVFTLALGCLLIVMVKTETEFGYSNAQWQLMFTVVFIVIALLLVLVIFRMNPLQFLPKNKLAQFGFHYKKDIIGLIQKEVPEIKEYIPYQKIHEKVFKAAGLFNSDYTDYKGDDWMKGEYRNVRFELCELLVLDQLKPFFHGFFVKFTFVEMHEPQYLALGNNAAIIYLFKEFESNYHAKIEKNTHDRNLYLAIHFEKRFLTYETRTQIENMEYDYYFLKDTIGLLKHLIDKVKVETPIEIY